MNVKLTGLKKIRILNSDDVFGIMQKVLLRENKIDRHKEHFWIIGLNLANKILFIELVCMGSVKAATVEPMNVFRVAVMKNAVKVILVHNHPSGGSGRQGLNLAGANPAILIARFRYVAIPQFVYGNHTSIAWCKRPGCPVACIADRRSSNAE